MTPPRRQDDGDQDDYRKLRGGSRPFNGHTKWIIAAVGAGILGALYFFAVADRDGFLDRTARAQARADAAFALAAESDKQIAVIRAEMHAQSEAIQAQTDAIMEIRKDQREILSRLPKKPKE